MSGDSPDLTVETLRKQHKRGIKVYQNKAALEFLRQELGWGALNISRIVTDGDVPPSTIRRWFKRHKLDGSAEEISISVHRGFSTIEHGVDPIVKHHRLLATLMVDDIDELEGKQVNFKDGCTFNVGLDNLMIGTRTNPKSRSGKRRTDESTHIEKNGTRPMIDRLTDDIKPFEKAEIARVMHDKGYETDVIASKLDIDRHLVRQMLPQVQAEDKRFTANA